MQSKKIKVALISCGLGNVQRGFETAAARWYDALASQSMLDVRLYCGGNYPQGIRVGNIRRDGRTMLLLRRLKLVHDGCRVEQFTFGLSFLKQLFDWKPDVIWVQEYTLAKLLKAVRPRLGLNYKILFCNGAPVGPQEYQEFDFIQHLHIDSYQNALAFGLSPDIMHVLPHCSPSPEAQNDAKLSRNKYGIEQNAWVITCVAAFNRHHKRIDYLIDEVAALNDPNVTLVLCGQPEADTPELKQLGEEKLKQQVHWMTIPLNQVYELMSLSDVFVLPSLTEGLGAVLIEAALCGVPIVCHPHSGGRAVVADGWPMPDLSQPGGLTARLREMKQTPQDRGQIERVRQRTAEHFSSPALAPRFAVMVHRLIDGTSSGTSISERKASAAANGRFT